MMIWLWDVNRKILRCRDVLDTIERRVSVPALAPSSPLLKACPVKGDCQKDVPEACNISAVNTARAILSPMAESIPAAEINAAAGILLSPSATGAVSSSIAAAGNHSAVSLLSPHAGALFCYYILKLFRAEDTVIHMDKLISSKQNIQHVPESYILPPERRPGKVVIPSSKCIPVIDLHGNTNRQELVQRIMKACQEFGFFELTGHGVPEDLMHDVLKVANEFFQLPSEDKVNFYSDNTWKKCRLHSSIDYDQEKVHFWRDNLRLPCHPLEDLVEEWPNNPARFREVIGNYAIRVRELSLLLLDLIREGLGLASGYFEGDLSETHLMNFNYYPPCPDPSLTLGLPKHSDPNLITILNQGAISGLQVLKDEQWLALVPTPNAFVVNIGHTLQVISNGMLRSGDHRVVTNAYAARATIASFIHPSIDCQIQPANELIIKRCSIPLYKPFPYIEFMRNYIKDTRDGDPVLKRYELSQAQA
ncbi:hypothetical protein BUALT_Bualt13G0018800 [Buddleja alternifolia]|uniref:Fe2OG dioxygenase domain-containing protein n=1 Tax=Buddleja alternifolia TaxID=168488 RepID=A0AAV6WR61_9LAMI|nr:hypothetical protein BUALT_Bualt13G0018800 [Buddleja alternifolia]